MSIHDQITIDGQPVAYEAAVAEYDVPARDGTVAARYVCVQYIRTDLDAANERAVTFITNGGPGSASTWLHLGLGPRRIAEADELRPRMAPPFAGLVENTESILDVTDLVFIDPPGTGFSRIVASDKSEELLSTDGDAFATIAFIEAWLRRNTRQHSPRFLLGESFGTHRMGRVARLAGGGPYSGGRTRSSHITGAIALGPELVMGEPGWAGDVRDAMELSTFAAITRFHSDRPSDVPSPAAVEAFAREEVLPALVAGAMLDDASRRRLAERIATITGLDVATVLRHRLRIDSDTFRKGVRAAHGEHVGAYDARYVLPASSAGQDPISDDPAMGQYGPAFMNAIEPYLRKTLGYDPDDEYRGIAFDDVLFRWNHGGPNGAPRLPHAIGSPPRGAFADYAEVLRRDSRFEVLIGVGDFDLVTTRGGTRYAMSRHDIDRTRVHERFYPAGHCPYLGQDARQALAADLRGFVGRLSAGDQS